MNLNGRRQSTNVESRTGNGTYDGNGNRIHGYGESGQLTRKGKPITPTTTLAVRRMAALAAAPVV